MAEDAIYAADGILAKAAEISDFFPPEMNSHAQE